ncbi:MAG: hypothetical protein FWG03_04110 [Clostridiales bacterium]|nr:hypothetical protein [Clostridiales bacterium]
MAGEEHREERDEAALAEARQRVYDVFDALGIPYEAFDHPPIFSAADEVRKDIKIDALICKNLFLRNKDKSRFYLFTLPLDKRADLVALQNALGETRLSFGDADALWDKLRIRPGSVSLLNIIGACEPGAEGGPDAAEGRHDATGEDAVAVKHAVAGAEGGPPLRFLVDAETLQAARIGVHPNDNAATIVFSPDRLPDIFAYYGADFDFISIG